MESLPQIDGYEAHELIGTGGFSRVYRATQTDLGRDVALKVLAMGMDAVADQQAFERECHALGSLSQHPNIVTVHGTAFTDEASPRPCLALALYPGGTLGERLGDSGALALDQTVIVGIKIAGALETAHQQGLIHRDLKPTNLFLSSYGEPALGDFGIARLLDDRTVTGAGGGLTVHYAPPELIEGARATAASDVYSLAASLFTLATGRHPFPKEQDQTLAQLATRVLLEPPPRLTSELVAGADVPDALAVLLLEAMDKDPEKRPHSAQEFGQRLQAIETDQSWGPTSMIVPGGKIMAEPTRSTAAPTSVGARPDGALPNGAGSEGRSRRGMLIAGALGLAVLAGGAWAVNQSGDEAPSIPTIELGPENSDQAGTGSGDADQFFGAPTMPSGITISATDDPTVLEVLWSPVEPDVQYEIQRVDGIHANDDPLTVVASPALLTVGDGSSTVCVVLRALGPGGRLSADTAPVCS